MRQLEPEGDLWVESNGMEICLREGFHMRSVVQVLIRGWQVLQLSPGFVGGVRLKWFSRGLIISVAMGGTQAIAGEISLDPANMSRIGTSR